MTGASQGEPATRLRERFGRVGVWLGGLGLVPSSRERDVVRRVEELGYGAIWFGEAFQNREALSHAAILLSATSAIPVATGIANIWARDAAAAVNGANTLNEAFPDRFLLGLGVSHAPIVNPRGHEYARPLAAMRAYLDAMDAHDYTAPAPEHPPARVLAALRPRMLELAAERAAGAHPYFVPPGHTRRARERLGAGPFLAPEQAVVLESDPTRARELARRHMRVYLHLPNYLDNLRTLGFDDGDLADGGSDRLVDAIVAWGDVDAIVRRVREHIEAGADHVPIQAIAESSDGALDVLAEIAGPLRGL